MYDTSDEVLGYHNEKVNLPSAERTNMRSRRDTNRSRLKKGLSDAGKPAPIGQHTQGSYAMHTMVQDADSDYDIDDGVYFRKGDLVGPNGGEMSALAVRQMVCDALRDNRFNTPPTILKNCVRVYYNEGFHVDVPSYRRNEITDSWTGKKTYTYELASSDWKSSDPLEVTRWFKRRNEHHSLDYADTDGQFCRVVRLLKMFARSRASWKQLTATGFMITKLADESFVASPSRDDFSLHETMKAIRWRLEANKTIAHPTLPGETITHDDDARPIFFKDRLIDNLKHLEILDSTDCEHSDAMAAWDRVFSTDWFSLQPPPNMDEDEGGSGSATGSRAPSRPVEKRSGGRYAWSSSH